MICLSGYGVGRGMSIKHSQSREIPYQEAYPTRNSSSYGLQLVTSQLPNSKPDLIYVSAPDLGGAYDETVGVSTQWSAKDLSPWFVGSWQSAQRLEHFTFSAILYYSLLFVNV